MHSMSIAITAVIGSSRRLRWLLAAQGAACAGAAVALAAGPGRFHAPWWLAAACAGAACVAWRAALRRANARQIDISGLGEIRLSVQQSLGAAPPPIALMTLLPGSTVWPSLLILLLRGGNGRVTVLTILPDSVTAGNFRKLAVSFTSIARRDNKFSKNNEIL
jgi:toxin CptA